MPRVLQPMCVFILVPPPMWTRAGSTCQSSSTETQCGESAASSPPVGPDSRWKRLQCAVRALCDGLQHCATAQRGGFGLHSKDTKVFGPSELRLQHRCVLPISSNTEQNLRIFLQSSAQVPRWRRARRAPTFWTPLVSFVNSVLFGEPPPKKK